MAHLPGTAKLLKHGEKLNVQELDVEPVFAKLAKDVNDTITKLVIKKIKEHPPYLSFAEAHLEEDGTLSDGLSGPAPSDPATLYLSIPLFCEDSYNASSQFSVTLESIVDYTLMSVEKDDGCKYEAHANGEVLKLAVRLRELADKIDRKVTSVTGKSKRPL